MKHHTKLHVRLSVTGPIDCLQVGENQQIQSSVQIDKTEADSVGLGLLIRRHASRPTGPPAFTGYQPILKKSAGPEVSGWRCIEATIRTELVCANDTHLVNFPACL